jgi:hypothetical protein
LGKARTDFLNPRNLERLCSKRVRRRRGAWWSGVLTVDGKELARKTIPHTILFLMAIDESFDIGSDTRTGVNDDYKLPFRFTGTIDKLTFKLGPSQLLATDQKAAEDDCNERG